MNKYKIFEAKSEKVDEYLSKMGTSRDSVREIFLDMTDQGYELKFKLSYKDANNRTRARKTTSRETPIVKIGLTTDRTSYVGGENKFEDLTYIEALYHCLSRFMNTYKGKVKKLTYSLDSKAELSVYCTFEEEKDDSKLSISKDIIMRTMDHALEGHLPNDYSINTRDSDFQGMYYFVRMNDDARMRKAKEMVAKLEESGDDWLTNHEELDELKANIRNEFTDLLSRSYSKDIRYIHRRGESPGIYVFENGKEMYKIANLSMYEHDSKRFTSRVKKGFLTKRLVECEIYYNIEIRLTLI